MFHFLFQFLKNPRRIGAIAPSGKYLAKKMVEPIQFERAACIVEFGPGTGVFTKEIIKRKKSGTLLLLIEQNEDFCRRLEAAYGMEENVHIIHGSAEQIEEYLKKYSLERADYIVSGLPFASLPKTVTEKIFEVTRRVIGSHGSFITFQYSLLKRKLFDQYFHLTGCRHEFRNLPPAYVLVMKKEKMEGVEQDSCCHSYS